MGTMPLPEPRTGRPQPTQGGYWNAEPAYTHHNDKFPSLSWGFLLYVMRWHMHRMTQTELARVLQTKQEYISRWERGTSPVPPTVRTFIFAWFAQRLADGLEVPLPINMQQPSRNDRQRVLMQQHGTFGGAGKKRKVA